MFLQLSAADPSTPAAHPLNEHIKHYVEQGPDAITQRLERLNREWTTGRAVMATCGVLLVASLILTLTVSPWWLLLAAIPGAIQLKYLFFKKTLLAELFARCGLRSSAQIEDERIALRVLRGDMKALPTLHQIVDRHAVNRMEDEGGPAHDDDEEKVDVKEAANVIIAGTTAARQ